ncbi:hypothetical protein [Dactylosporangium darangshiense]
MNEQLRRDNRRGGAQRNAWVIPVGERLHNAAEMSSDTAAGKAHRISIRLG